MARSIAEIIADHKVTEAELEELVARYDANGDGRLDGEEVREFAREVSALLKSDVADVIDILSFYQADDDVAFDPQEIRSFLELHLT